MTSGGTRGPRKRSELAKKIARINKAHVPASMRSDWVARVKREHAEKKGK